MQTLLITGGAGFIGSNLVRHVLATTSYRIVIIDSLTYAGNLESLADCLSDERCSFVRGSINDRSIVRSTLSDFAVEAIIHLAAESHVDRSIQGAEPFAVTNVLGTLVLLEEARQMRVARFLHVSTDEVYGSLLPNDPPFTESSPLHPSSPYAASKASSDHFVMSYHVTHNLDTVITRCSNNYGPYQFPEKFIPLMTLNALEGRPLPIYGDGKQIRDWLHVTDHCTGILQALEKGVAGETYNFGGSNEQANIDVARLILHETGASERLLTFVTDRPGHDRRYAIDATKAATELGWSPLKTFADSLRETIAWYRTHSDWCDHVRSGEYRTFYERQYHSTL